MQQNHGGNVGARLRRIQLALQALGDRMDRGWDWWAHELTTPPAPPWVGEPAGMVRRIAWAVRTRARRLGMRAAIIADRPFGRRARSTMRALGNRMRPAHLRGWRPTPAQSILGAALIVLSTWGGWQRCGVSGCPNVDLLAAYQPGGAPVLLDRDGEVFATLAPYEREVVPLDELPAHVPAAFLAVEDQRFYEHAGIDWRRVAGAALADLRAGGFVQGSSTISMQLARNLFPDRVPGAKRTPGRKLLEVRVAREIESSFEKDEILELYLNHIYFGGSAYGIEAAARYYFGRSARGLTLSQAAILAALPRGPTLYDPRRHPDRARDRRDLVLRLMAEQERVSWDEAEAARKQRLGVRAEPPPDRRDPPDAPYFVDEVRRELEDRFGDALYGGGFRIHTTLDRRVQRIAERELERQLRSIEWGAHGRFNGTRYAAGTVPERTGTDYLQGAIAIIEAETGDVLALVGGRDYRHSAYNRATRSRRPAGSSFKPFVYAAALERGYAASQRIADEPLRLELAGGEVWEPQNIDGTFEGEVSLRDALVRSRNLPTIRLAQAVGEGRVARMAQRSGVRSPVPNQPSMAIGTGGLSPLELTIAYATFARADGRAVEPRLVSRFEDENGELVYEFEPRDRRAVNPAVAFLVTNMLAESVDRGTATAVRSAGFRGPAAGKTGTTDGRADAWFIGYAPDLVAGVWIGHDRPSRITDQATGGRVAAPLWGRMMRQVYSDRPMPAAWAPPERIVEREVDPVTGLVLAEGCRPARGSARTEYFLKGSVPASICPDGEERDGEPGLWQRFTAVVRNVWHEAGTRLAGLIGRDDDEPEPARPEDHLGAPRLPRAQELRTPELREPPRLLGTPVDSLPADDERRRLRPADEDGPGADGDEADEPVATPDQPPILPDDTVPIIEPPDTGEVEDTAVAGEPERTPTGQSEEDGAPHDESGLP